MSPWSAPTRRNLCRKYLPFAAILIAGLVLRIMHLMEFRALPVFDHVTGADVSEYWNRALAYAAGTGALGPDIHGPLYPLFLAGLIRLTGGGMFAIRLIQAVVSMLSVVPFRLILRRYFANRRDRMRFLPDVFAAVYVCYPPLVAMQCEFFAETLLLPLLSAAAWFYAGRPRTARSLAICGIFCGLAVSTHPLSVFFPVLLILSELFRGRARLRRSSALGLGCLLGVFVCVLPMSVASGRFVPVQGGGAFNFWLGNSAYADGTCRIPPGREWDEIHLKPAQAGESDTAYFLRDTAASWRNPPPDALSPAALLWRKLVLPVSYRELTTWSDVSILGRTRFQRLGRSCFFGILAAASIAAVILFGRERLFRGRMRVFLLLFAAVWLGQTVFVSAGRYRIPMIPAVCALAAYLALYRAALYTWRTLAVQLAAVAVGASIVFGSSRFGFLRTDWLEHLMARSYLAEAYALAGDPSQTPALLPGSPRHVPRSVAGRFFSLRMDSAIDRKAFDEAESLLKEAASGDLVQPTVYEAAAGRFCAETGDIEGAETHYRAALETADGEFAATIAYNYGVLKMGANDAEGALELFMRSAELNPAFASAWTNAGVCRMSLDRYPQAAEAFRKALSLDPGDPVKLVNLAAATAFAGRRDEAVSLLKPLIESGRADSEARSLWEYLTKRL